MCVSIGGRRTSALRSVIEYRWPRNLDDDLAAAIVALYNDSIKTEDVLGFTQPLTDGPARIVTAAIDGALRRGEKHFFGIYMRAELIGMALLTPNALPNCSHIVEWSKGIIHSEYRGSGVLKPALYALGLHCREMGWDIVTLDVRAESRAHRIWSLFGFQEYGRLADYARIQGRAQAGAFMFARVADILRICAPGRSQVAIAGDGGDAGDGGHRGDGGEFHGSVKC
jgi:hypothetical protein